MTIIAEIINSIPDIENKAYAELGTCSCATFDKVQSNDKWGCDIQPQVQPQNVYKSSTTSFIEAMVLSEHKKFDIVFIDANHTWPCVVDDYNNSLRMLKKNGVIFAHDLNPPDAAHAPDRNASCGNGYKLLIYLLRNKIKENIFVCKDRETMGLTLFAHPQRIDMSDEDCTQVDRYSFDMLNVLRSTIRTYTVEEMKLICENMCGTMH